MTDGDGIADLIVGQPIESRLYVLLLQTDGTVSSFQRIDQHDGGLPPGLGIDPQERFATSLAYLGDLDGDGVGDILVGEPEDDDGGLRRGAVWVLFLDAGGTVKAFQKISSTSGGFAGALEDSDTFGRSVAAIGDLDGDGVTEVAVGAPGSTDGGSFRNGSLWILFLNADGTVKDEQKISSTHGGFSEILDDTDLFGDALHDALDPTQRGRA